MNLNLLAPIRRKAQPPLYVRKQRRSNQLAVCALMIVLGAVSINTRVRAADRPQSYVIYLFGSCGSVMNVTDTYSFHDNHLFDPDGAQVGTGDGNGNILDTNGADIGYLVSTAPACS